MFQATHRSMQSTALRLLAAGLMVVVWGVSTLLAEPTNEQIGLWITQLSDDSYLVRQVAADRLLEAGIAAREPLLPVADGPDPEARAAARRLITLIDQLEFERQLVAFAADVDGQQGITLAGWDEFRELAGDDASARALFVDIHRAEPTLVADAFSDLSRASETRWEERLVRLIQGNRIANRRVKPSLGSCAAMVFFGTLKEFSPSTQAANYLVNLIQQPPTSEALIASERNLALRRLVVRWILNSPNNEPRIIMDRLKFIPRFGLTEALPMAIEVARAEGEFMTVDLNSRIWALNTIGQMGDLSHVPELEPMFQDDTICTLVQSNQPATAVQIRDVALAMAIHLSGQNPKDFGFTKLRPQQPGAYQIKSLELGGNDGRAKAFAKWDHWRKRNPSIEDNDS